MSVQTTPWERCEYRGTDREKYADVRQHVCDARAYRQRDAPSTPAMVRRMNVTNAIKDDVIT